MIISHAVSQEKEYEKCGSELERPYPSPKGKEEAYKLGEIVFLIGRESERNIVCDLKVVT